MRGEPHNHWKKLAASSDVMHRGHECTFSGDDNQTCGMKLGLGRQVVMHPGNPWKEVTFLMQKVGACWHVGGASVLEA